jgi:hypothetical protein
VTAAVRPARGEVERVVARGTSCVEYFIRCDATQTELLFGSGFKVLLDSLRSEDKSLSAIYAKVNYRSENTVQLTTRISREERKKRDIWKDSEEGDDDGGMLK